MTSLAEGQHEWNADRVRETFLDYFKKNGHTFGRSRAFGELWCIFIFLTTIPHSALVLGRAAL
jgi:hypothetical protein